MSARKVRMRVARLRLMRRSLSFTGTSPGSGPPPGIRPRSMRASMNLLLISSGVVHAI
jgi:hypothetical protein